MQPVDPPKKNKKLRHILAALIIALGIISITLVYLASNTYFNLTITHQRDSLKAAATIAASRVFADLEDQQAEIGMLLQQEETFLNSFTRGDWKTLQAHLNQSFQRIFRAGDLSDLLTLTVYDNDLTYLNQSSGTNSLVSAEPIVHCPDLVTSAKTRTGADRRKIMSQRCLLNNKTIQSVLVPIGDRQPLGYLQICISPFYSLRKLESELGMPIQLRTTGGEFIYASGHWPTKASNTQLFINHNILASDDSPLLKLYVAQDISTLIDALNSSRNNVLTIALFIVAVAIAIILLIMNRALKPLTNLQRAAARIARGQYEPISNQSCYEEIATPIASFNKMAEDLSQENRSRTLAQDALKLATIDAERLAQKSFEEKKFTQTTLNSIKDGVITTNTDNRVLFMNPAAAKLTGVDPGTAIGHSLEEVFPIDDSFLQAEEFTGQSKPNEELRLRRADGDEIEIEAISSTMYSPYGDTIGRVTVFSDVTKQRELTRRLSYAATHDPLTGLVNRSEFERRLEETIRVAHMDNSEHALCYMDLDQFKIVNDTCGHIAGDELLRQITGLLQSQVSRRDTLGRLGGDEFGLLMENCGLDTAQEVASKLLTSMRRYQFVWEEHTFSVGCSIGIVKFDGMGESMAKLMSAADTACYIAKDRGRNRIEIARAENIDLEKRQGEMQWVLKINAALKEQNFVLYRQLIAPCHSSNEPAHYEILIRLKGDNGELIPPDTFMPAAERFNLITKIDKWVVSTTMKWLKELPKEEKIEVSINLSGTSITNQQFMDFVVLQIHDADIDPERICFEITETAAIANLSHAQEFMSILTGLGCRFALDDFGSGLSSFAYLRSLPVQYLKIDGLFIRNVHQNPVDLALVRSINEVGHAMGLLTVAEFVEQEEIAEILREIGIDYLQGYAIARPEPLASPHH